LTEESLVYVLKSLVASNIKFSLIREINLDNLQNMADFDVFMTLNEFVEYLDYLDRKQVYYELVNPYVLNKKQLLIKGVLLDIDIDFISYDLYKCISFKPDLTKINSELNVFGIILPIFCKEYLYHIWLLHFILDKSDFNGGSTSKLFYNKYSAACQGELKYLTPIVNSLNLSKDSKRKMNSIIQEFNINFMKVPRQEKQMIKNIHIILQNDFLYRSKFLCVRVFFAFNRRINFV
jgi:hypothetical protein